MLQNDHLYSDDDDNAISIEERVFSISVLMRQILSHCQWLDSFPRLLSLRLVSKDFSNAITTLQTFPNDIQDPSLSILKITGESSKLFRLEQSDVAAINPRMTRSVKAEFGYGFGELDSGRDHRLADSIGFANILDICVAFGENIQSLIIREFRPAENRLHLILRLVNDHSPNLKSLRIYGINTCPCDRSSWMNDGEVINFTLQPFLALTELEFGNCIWIGEEWVEEECGYAYPIISSLISASPNLTSLDTGHSADFPMDLSNNKSLRTFEHVVQCETPISQVNIEKLKQSINSCSQTLEEFKIVYAKNAEFPEHNDDNSADIVSGLTFPKLRKLTFMSIQAPGFKFHPYYLSLILSGRVPLLQELNLCTDDDWENILLKLAVQPALKNVKSLEIYTKKTSLLYLLIKSFPNVTIMNMRIHLSDLARVEEDVCPELLTAFNLLPGWNQLTKINVEFAGVLSILHVKQILECVGKTFFERGIQALEVMAKKDRGTDASGLEELGKTFGMVQLEQFLPMLRWMKDMKEVEWKNIVMPPGTDIRGRLMDFILEHRLTVKFPTGDVDGDVLT